VIKAPALSMRIGTVNASKYQKIKHFSQKLVGRIQIKHEWLERQAAFTRALGRL
jgi:hypothetical protein